MCTPRNGGCQGKRLDYPLVNFVDLLNHPGPSAAAFFAEVVVLGDTGQEFRLQPGGKQRYTLGVAGGNA